MGELEFWFYAHFARNRLLGKVKKRESATFPSSHTVREKPTGGTLRPPKLIGLTRAGPGLRAEHVGPGGG